MKSQSAALPFTPVYAAMVGVLNTKFPQLGELLITRLIIQFRRAYRRNDKLACLAVTRFLAHLVNHKVAHEIISLQILTLLLEKATDDAVEIAVGFVKECGAALLKQQSRAMNAIFERFRTILHEAKLDIRTQYMIEVLFQIRKDKFKDFPTCVEDLDLVEEEDQVTHYLSLDDEDLDAQDGINVFRLDPKFLESEAKYLKIKHEVLGSDDEEGSDADDGSEASESDNEDDDGAQAQSVDIIDSTGQDVLALRKTIFLTIMSSLDFEECCHKLMKLQMAPGQEPELVRMIIECCSEERTYKKFYGLMAERFCRVNQLWMNQFSQAFVHHFETIHRFDSSHLRNISKLYAHCLARDALPWTVMECIRLTEDTTTSSSRIFVKILFQEIKEEMGMVKLVDRLLSDPFLKPSFDGLFPRDTPRNTRFAINYWTSIGMGAVTEELRDWLKAAPALAAAKAPQVSESSSDDSSSDSDSDSSDSGSESDSSSASTSSSDSSSSESSGHRRKRRRR
jgi:pre-mRNA-splicing factor CWC22